MKKENFREAQINSTTEYCVNEYWEVRKKVKGVDFILYYWRRKEGCKGFNGRENLSRVVGVKGKKRRSVNSVWVLNLGAEYCIKEILNRFVSKVV